MRSRAYTEAYQRGFNDALLEKKAFDPLIGIPAFLAAAHLVPNTITAIGKRFPAIVEKFPRLGAMLSKTPKVIKGVVTSTLPSSQWSRTGLRAGLAGIDVNPNLKSMIKGFNSSEVFYDLELGKKIGTKFKSMDPSMSTIPGEVSRNFMERLTAAPQDVQDTFQKNLLLKNLVSGMKSEGTSPLGWTGRKLLGESLTDPRLGLSPIAEVAKRSLRDKATNLAVQGGVAAASMGGSLVNPIKERLVESPTLRNRIDRFVDNKLPTFKKIPGFDRIKNIGEELVISPYFRDYPEAKITIDDLLRD